MSVKVGRKLAWAQNSIETVYAHNKSGASVAPGDVVIFDATNSTATDVAFTTTITKDHKMGWGMSIENIASNAYGEIQTKGPTASICRVNGTTDISKEDPISTYSAKKIGQQATAGKGGNFAVALEAYIGDDSNGTISVWLTGSAARIDTSSYASSFASPTLTGSISMNGVTTFNSTGLITCDGPGGGAGTAAITLTVGDITISDGKISVTDADSTTDIVTIACTTGILGTAKSLLYLDSNGNIASDSHMMLLDCTDGTPVDGAIGIKINSEAKLMQGIYSDSDRIAGHCNTFHGGGALTNDNAVLAVTSDGAIAANGNLFRIDYTGTPAADTVKLMEIDGDTKDCQALYIDSDSTKSAVYIHGAGALEDNNAMLEVFSEGTTINGSSLVYIHSATAGLSGKTYGLEINCAANNLEALWVSAGECLFADHITMGTTSKIYFTDTSQYIYAPADDKIDLVATTWTKIASGPFIVGIDGTGYDVTFNGTGSNYKVWYDVDLDTSGTWLFGANQYGVDVTWYGAASGDTMKWDKSASLLTITSTAVGNDGRALKISTISATPAMSDGYGVVEIDCTISGTATGWFSPLSSWVNVTGSGVMGTGGYICAQQNGVFADAGANTGSTVIFGMRASALLTGAPSVLCPFSLNTANRSIDALFHIASGPSAGLVNGTMSSTADGTIPIVIDAGGAIRYVHVYSDRN